MKEIAVCYHKGCLDGFSGAWAAWKKLGTKAEYIGLEHQEEVPKSLKGRTLYFIDFCYPVPVMKKIIASNKRVIVLDHHKSQYEAIKLANEYRYILDHSGCVIAWNYFHPGKAVPHLLSIIEDNDLFRFSLPITQKVISVLQFCAQSFDVYDSYVKKIERNKSRSSILHDGEVIRYAENVMIERLIERAQRVMFEGHRVYAVNTPLFYSEIANALSRKKGGPFGIAWFFREGKLQVSLRTAHGRVNMAHLAKKYGGGGHVRAAGFSMDFKGSFPWKPL